MSLANEAYIKIVTNRNEVDIVHFKDSILIGRAGCGLEGIYEINSPLVSRKHGRIYGAMGRFFYEDLGGTNGTYINNLHLGGEGVQTKLLSDKDILRIGDEGQYPPVVIQFMYNKPDDEVIVVTSPEEKRVIERVEAPIKKAASAVTKRPEVNGMGPVLSVAISERSVTTKGKKKVLLSDIRMDIKSGEFVLILGGSGAGKTTFMNAVMGYEKADGTIKYGDIDLYENYEAVKYSVGFVPQQELLRTGDSVIETLKNAAEVKMPAHSSTREKSQRIDEILDMMGLVRERETQVQKLSGGQKKRLSIAVELIVNPGLFFLDEPDSGLDGIMARSLMTDLREIADKGKIVMIITHGPDRAIDLFDKVIVLAKGADNTGHLAFYGSVPEALDYFETDSLEGVVRRINRKDEGGDGLSDKYIEKFAEYNS